MRQRSPEAGARTRGGQLGGLGRGAIAPALLAGILIFAIHAVSPNMTIADSLRNVPAAESLVSSRSFDIGWTTTGLRGGAGTNGIYREPRDRGTGVYPSYPLGPVLVAVPVVIAAHVWHAVAGGPTVRERLARDGTWKLERLTASLVMGATAAVMVLVALLALPLGLRRRRAVACAVGLAFGLATPAWTTGSRALWQQSPSMLVLAFALLAALLTERHARAVYALGVSCGLAYWMRPTNFVAILVFAVWLAPNVARLARYAAGLVVTLVPLVVVNLHVYGGVLAPYYHPGYQRGKRHVLEALAGNLVSTGRGVFVWSPILLLALVGAGLKVWRRDATRLDVAIWSAIVLHWLVLSSGATDWVGGNSLGPRFMADMVPFLVFAALPALGGPWPQWATARRGMPRAFVGAAAVLLVFSVAVEFEGATMRATNCWNVYPKPVSHQSQRAWSLRHSQLLVGYQALLHGHSFSDEANQGGNVTHPCTSQEG